MPIQLSEADGGKLLNVHVSGKLTGADYDHFVPEFERLVGEHGKLRVLFDMTDFHGWDAGALWKDTKFAVKHFADIARIAMVGETKWQHGMATFCKPFTKASVQYFDHTQLTEARAWLDKAQWIDFVHVDNKDASLFPVAIPNHRGKLQLAMIHRPLFPGSLPEETDCDECLRLVDLDHESIWISYCPMALEGLEPDRLVLFNSHHRLATPVAPWEALKIGGGTPPVMTRHGWMMLYHGVHRTDAVGGTGKHLCYSAGVMILSKEHPRTILYRSPAPLLTPLLPQERDGVVENVAFPTGIDCRHDIGQPDRCDIYYGMADSRIGVASMKVPQRLPTTPLPRVDAPNAIVPVVPLPAEATT